MDWWWYIFPMPDASLELINWDASVLSEYWTFILIALLVIVLANNIWFYFFTLPNATALKRYWYSKLILYIIFIIAGLIFLHSKTTELAGSFQSFSIWRLLYLFVILSLDYWLMSFIFYVIFLLISCLPSRLQIRAMRRYPFYIKNIN